MKKQSKTLVLVAAAVFALRGITCAQGPDDMGGPPHHGHPDITAMLSHTLELSDDQKAKVQTMVENMRPQMEAIHEQARTQMDALMKQLHTQMRPLLNAEQQKKLDALETLHHHDHAPE